MGGFALTSETTGCRPAMRDSGSARERALFRLWGGGFALTSETTGCRPAMRDSGSARERALFRLWGVRLRGVVLRCGTGGCSGFAADDSGHGGGDAEGGRVGFVVLPGLAEFLLFFGSQESFVDEFWSPDLEE